ncbi:MAG: response regulator [Bacteroidetes bacterium]|nr:MAG: response regulator [Bacteroidota bacterium]
MIVKKITVLYVDDEPINLKLFFLNLQKRFNIITAKSGYEGLEQLKLNSNIDVVISDMKMPGMNGIEFIRKASGDFPDVLYFILTGFDINEEIADALNERLIYKYFRKPFNIEEIETTITNLFR